MKYFRLIATLSVAALVLSACVVSSANTPTQALSLPTQAATEAATQTPTILMQTPTAPPVQEQASATVPAANGKLISKNGISFVIPVGLGTDALSNIVPEMLAPEGAPGGNPAYMQFKLQGYPVAGDEYFYAEVQVYDAKAYAADFAVGASNSKSLNDLLAAPNTPLTRDVLPHSYLTMASNMKRLSSESVKGVRMLSVHGNGMPIVTNKDLSYQFHGLTADGKFYILVNLPVTAPFLPADLDTPAAEGLIMFPKEATDNAIPEYLAKVSNLLDQAETSGMLSPSIGLMDTLIESLKISSAEVLLPAPLPTSIPAINVEPTQTAESAASIPCEAVGFLEDVTYPDGTQVNAGENFVKTWRIKNTGTCTWNGNYSLVFFNGEQMNGASPTVASASPNSVLPGGQIDVSIPMQAPSNPGTYIGYWAFTNSAGVQVPMSNGAPFQISVNIVVK